SGRLLPELGNAELLSGAVVRDRSQLCQRRLELRRIHRGWRWRSKLRTAGQEERAHLAQSRKDRRLGAAHPLVSARGDGAGPRQVEAIVLRRGDDVRARRLAELDG